MKKGADGRTEGVGKHVIKVVHGWVEQKQSSKKVNKEKKSSKQRKQRVKKI